MKTNKCVLTGLVIALVIGLTFGVGKAATVKITGVTATASSYENRRAPGNVVNESGFDPITRTVTANVPNDTMWNTANKVTKANTWIKFDMGSTADIGEMWVFNYNDTWQNSENRRFISADIWYSATGSTVNPTDATPGDWTKLINDQAFTEAPYTTSYNTPDEITLNLKTRYVLMNDIVNAGATVWGNGYGLSEVEFTYSPPPAGAILIVR